MLQIKLKNNNTLILTRYTLWHTLCQQVLRGVYYVFSKLHLIRDQVILNNNPTNNLNVNVMRE